MFTTKIGSHKKNWVSSASQKKVMKKTYPTPTGMGLIHKVDFCLANVFFLKNVWLTLSACYYGLTLL